MLYEIMNFGSRMGMEQFYKKDLCPTDLLITEDVSYADDNLEAHKLDIIYPSAKKKLYPFILNIHGGSFAMHSKDKLYRNHGMRLAGNDFAVVNINYRLAPKNVYPAQIEDVLLAITFIARHADSLQLDKNNMFLAGDSAGAYLAAITACVLSSEVLQKKYQFHTDITCRALAANSGMYDFTTLMGKDISFPMKRKMIELLFGRPDFENSPHYSYSSVLTYVDINYPPVYLMDTPKYSFEKEALRFAEVLKKQGVPYKLHIFEKRENLKHAFHIMGKYPQSKIVLDEIFEFFGGKVREVQT